MTEKQKNICVIGLGYIGLPTAALLADRGNLVWGVDVDTNVVDTVNAGGTHIFEPGLREVVRKVTGSGKLKAGLTPKMADIYIICVPTPFMMDRDSPTPNLDYVKSACNSIAPLVKDGDIVILESTSPVGTTELVRDQIVSHPESRVSKVFVAYCPERVLPGKIMVELIENARVVGGVDSEATDQVVEFYKTFVKGEILKTDCRTAEMCKLTENSFRDVNIAFANELSILCADLGVNVWSLIDLANRHPRVDILKPGAGVGGHCIAVDPWFIVSENPRDAQIIRTARLVNDNKPRWVADRIIAAALHSKTKKIACLGLTFKPDIDDLRQSPAVIVVNLLIERGYEVYCVEPNVPEHTDHRLIDLREALEEFKVVALLVGHKQFTEPNVRKALSSRETLDFCGLLSQ